MKRRCDVINENLNNFNSKLNEFRRTERHSDVTITCENENFKCHRVILASASEYFDTLFGDSSKESADRNVVLNEMSAAIFKEVVRFIYTGDVKVSHSNVHGLLRASEFLKLTGLERLVVRFVLRNKMSVENTFDVFMFARATKNEILISTLIYDIVKQFRIFSRSQKFLEISFDDLRALMNQWISLGTWRNDEELYVGAFIRWLSHCQEIRCRRQYIEKYFELFRFQNLTSKYTRFVFTKLLLAEHNAFESMRVDKPIVGFNEVKVVKRSSAAATKRKSLNVFVRFSNKSMDEAKVLTIFNKNQYFTSSKIFDVPSDQGIRSIALDDDHLYCVHYPRAYSVMVDPPPNDQSFRLYNSVDLRSGIDLKNPPVIFKDLRLCTLQNSIYACSKSSLFQCTPTKVSSSTNSSRPAAIFTDEEMKRGTYVYNCDLDDWFPMPAMDEQFYTCSATTSSGILYLLGSEHPYEQGIPKSTLQIRAYDYRLGKWLNHPQGNVTHFMETDCCVLDRYPYDIMTHPLPQQMATYDIKARKWKEFDCAKSMRRPGQCLRLLSYSNLVWAIGDSIEHEPSYLFSETLQLKNYSINKEFCSTRINHWNTVISQAVRSSTNEIKGVVLDAVVL